MKNTTPRPLPLLSVMLALMLVLLLLLRGSSHPCRVLELPLLLLLRAAVAAASGAPLRAPREAIRGGSLGYKQAKTGGRQTLEDLVPQ